MTNRPYEVPVLSYLRDALANELAACRAVLAERERELLELKGPCSNARCRLHGAHSGPCAVINHPSRSDASVSEPPKSCS